MKKRILTVLIIFMIAVLFLMSRPFKLNKELIRRSYSENNSYITTFGLDPTAFLNVSKQMIKDNKLTFIKKFKRTYYTSPSDNRFLFSRDWSLASHLDYNGLAGVDLDATLWQDEESDLHIIIQYEITSSGNTGSYFEVKHADNYNLKLNYHEAYLIYQGNEYVDETIHDSYNLSLKKFALDSSNFNQSFKYPQSVGFYHLELEKLNKESKDMVLIDINYFSKSLSDSNNIILGFNSFRTVATSNQYVPGTLSVNYNEEDL